MVCSNFFCFLYNQLYFHVFGEAIKVPCSCISSSWEDSVRNVQLWSCFRIGVIFLEYYIALTFLRCIGFRVYGHAKTAQDCKRTDRFYSSQVTLPQADKALNWAVCCLLSWRLLKHLFDWIKLKLSTELCHYPGISWN